MGLLPYATGGAPVFGPAGARRTVDAARSGSVRHRDLVVEHMLRKSDEVEVFRITGARRGLADDVRGRQRRYVISMSVRTVSVVLAAVLWNVERHVAIVALVLGVLLPYIAVVIANAGRENAPSLPSTYLSAPVRPAVEAAPAAGSAESAGPHERSERVPPAQEHR